MKSPQIKFSEIYSKYEKPVFNYILRMTPDRADAEDLTQELFVKVYQNLPGFQGKSKLSTWIYKIATNACTDHFRTSSYKKDEKTQLLETDVSQDDSCFEENQRILSIEDHFIKEEMGECIRDFVDKLPQDFRAVVVLHDLRGLKNREIAEILACSLDTVKIRLHRARKELRAILAANCDFYRDEADTLCCDKK